VKERCPSFTWITTTSRELGPLEDEARSDRTEERSVDQGHRDERRLLGEQDGNDDAGEKQPEENRQTDPPGKRLRTGSQPGLLGCSVGSHLSLLDSSTLCHLDLPSTLFLDRECQLQIGHALCLRAPWIPPTKREFAQLL